MSYKVFVAGDVLTAAQVNDNLMEQAVATFSTTGARDSTITSPNDGQMVFTEDADIVWIYDGSASVSASGFKAFPHITRINAKASGPTTISASDAGCVIDVNSNGTSSVFIPAHSAVAFTNGTTVTITQSGASALFITACPTASWVASTKTAASATSGSLTGQYAVATLIKSASNTWYAFGNLA
jgi:hypothetical protein